MYEKIEILSIDLLEEERETAVAIKEHAQRFGIGLGWHYLLDLTWILREARQALGGDSFQSKKILDAGAGVGILQWYLAEHGAEVISADRSSRARLSLRFRARYSIRGLRKTDLDSPVYVLRSNIASAKDGQERLITAARGLGAMLLIALPKRTRGKAWIYNQNLSSLMDIPSDSQDLVVAVSALEHNSPEKLPGVVEELMRVLKPGGVLLATLCASCEKDWFHEPSQGWCYTENTLRRLFCLSENTSANYELYDRSFERIASCEELRDNLADFYFRSGDNGMPWGEWNPKYQPVGVRKVKQSSGAQQKRAEDRGV
jgi:SAM-dependent methyltransferase